MDLLLGLGLRLGGLLQRPVHRLDLGGLLHVLDLLSPCSPINRYYGLEVGQQLGIFDSGGNPTLRMVDGISLPIISMK